MSRISQGVTTNSKIVEIVDLLLDIWTIVEHCHIAVLYPYSTLQVHNITPQFSITDYHCPSVHHIIHVPRPSITIIELYHCNIIALYCQIDYYKIYLSFKSNCYSSIYIIQCIIFWVHTETNWTFYTILTLEWSTSHQYTTVTFPMAKDSYPITAWQATVHVHQDITRPHTPSLPCARYTTPCTFWHCFESVQLSQNPRKRSASHSICEIVLPRDDITGSTKRVFWLAGSTPATAAT